VTNWSMQAAPSVCVRSRINRIIGSMVSAGIAGIASMAVTINAYIGTSHPVRLAFIFALLIGLHLLIVPKLWLSRELKIYLAFVAYMLLSLVWTQNVQLAMNTVTLAINFALILILFGALVAYHNRRAVVKGMLAGFLIAAIAYTLTQHFPFVYPESFSYNSIASMYLFGLFATIVFGWFTRRALVPIAISVLLLVLIAATTSIKTNLGIALGAVTAGIFYFRHVIMAMRKTLILFLAIGVLIVFAIYSNDAFVDQINAGIDRVNLGIHVLLAREDISGDTTLDARKKWESEGLRGWLQNPVFGYGAEEFRTDYGITSHSTPVDLLYNFGLIGFGLFYATLISLGWRIHRAMDSATSALRPFLLGLLICYLFISLSGTMYYDALLAVFVATSAALLRPAPSEKCLSNNSRS